MSHYRNQLEDWLKKINVKGFSALDIGGGANPVKGRTKTWGVTSYHIADNDIEKTYHKEWYSTTPLDLNTDMIHGQYSNIFCLEVFEYIYDPIHALKAIYLGLEADGVAYISFPAVYPPHEPRGHDYMRYTRYGVDKLLRVVGFSKYKIIERKANDEGAKALADFYRADGMHPLKNSEEIYHTGYMVTAHK